VSIDSVGIVGNYGHHNVGDEAILSVLISQLDDVRPGSEIVIFGDDSLDTQKRFPDCTCLPVIVPGPNRAVRAVRTLAHWWRTLRRLSLLVVGGGGLFVDSYQRTPWQFTALILLARLARTKVLCYQIGAGPITTAAGRALFKLSAEIASTVSVRDTESERALRQIGVRRELLVQADPALLLEPAPGNVSLFGRRSEPRLCVGIAPIPYCMPGFWYEADRDRFGRYVAEFSDFADHLVRQYRAVPVFFRFSRGDDEAARAIRQEMQHATEAVILPEEHDPQTLLALVGQTDLFVGTRLHSLIFATRMKVPAMAIAYQEKVHNYLRAIDQENRVLGIDTLSSRRLVEQFEALYNARVQIRAQLERTVPRLQDRARLGTILLVDPPARRTV
jgi:polysaccharide pyruvyl transferase CsaB